MIENFQGKSLVTGSFDVLEAIGKKTFDVLTVTDEDDGGRRRFVLSQHKTNLSQVSLLFHDFILYYISLIKLIFAQFD